MINCVFQGFTLKPLIEREMEWGLVTSEEILLNVPTHQFSKPMPIATLVLASDAPCCVAGTALMVDEGGQGN